MNHRQRARKLPPSGPPSRGIAPPVCPSDRAPAAPVRANHPARRATSRRSSNTPRPAEDPTSLRCPTPAPPDDIVARPGGIRLTAHAFDPVDPVTTLPMPGNAIGHVRPLPG
ncbi:hypothetical protein SRB17_43870 [Streptomyces sp. RB17]|nr:hypothetical protein [Streptomyces sp. RB17]